MCLWLKNLQIKLQTGANIPIKYDNGLIYHMKETEKYVIKEGIRKAEKYKWPLNIWKIFKYICNLKMQYSTLSIIKYLLIKQWSMKTNNATTYLLGWPECKYWKHQMVASAWSNRNSHWRAWLIIPWDQSKVP